MRIPRVSVIIPTYNHAKYVGEAIQSVIEQTYRDFEIIVLDDGSTDHTHEVVGQYENQVRYIWQKNQGLSAARNNGILEAEGEFIALLDADDLYEPDFLSTLVTILEEKPDADAVYCIAQTVDIANNPLPQQIGKVVSPDYFYETLLNGGFFPPSCMFAHRYCYENNLFDESLHRVEDIDLWLRFAQQFTIIGTNDVLLRYRIMPQSLSSDPSIVLDHRIAVLKRYLGITDIDETNWGSEQREVIGRSYLATVYEYIQLHDIEQTYHHLKRAYNMAPQLVSDENVMYEICLGDQPKGYRGSFKSINLDRNAELIQYLLVRLFDDPNTSDYVMRQQKKAFGYSYLALGLISYGMREFRDARRYLFLALIRNPIFLLSGSLLITLLKSTLPVKLVDWLRNRRLVMGANPIF